MHVRAATPEDIPQMIALAESCESAAHWNRRAYEAIFDPNSPTRIALVTDQIDIDQSEEGASAVRGFIVGACCGSEWEIENVVVAESMRGHGLGRALVSAFIDTAEKCNADRIFLEVRASNTVAHHLYLGCGFRQAGTRKNYYSNPEEDAFLLEYLFPQQLSKSVEAPPTRC